VKIDEGQQKIKSSAPTNNQICWLPTNQFSPSAGTTLLFKSCSSRLYIPRAPFRHDNDAVFFGPVRASTQRAAESSPFPSPSPSKVTGKHERRRNSTDLGYRLIYQAEFHGRTRQSLNGNYDLTQQALGEGSSGRVLLATVFPAWDHLFVVCDPPAHCVN